MSADESNKASFCKELNVDEHVLGQELSSDESSQGGLWSVDEC